MKTMTKCKQAVNGNCTCGEIICCLECEKKNECPATCSLVETKAVKNAKDCEDAISEGTEMVAFEQKAITIMQSIADIATKKAELDEQDKEMRKQLESAMEQYGVKSFENDILKITYVEPTTRTSVDSAKLKKKYPSVFAECSKTSEVKGSVRITVKN